MGDRTEEVEGQAGAEGTDGGRRGEVGGTEGLRVRDREEHGGWEGGTECAVAGRAGGGAGREGGQEGWRAQEGREEGDAEERGGKRARGQGACMGRWLRVPEAKRVATHREERGRGGGTLGRKRRSEGGDRGGGNKRWKVSRGGGARWGRDKRGGGEQEARYGGGAQWRGGEGEGGKPDGKGGGLEGDNGMGR